MWFGVIAALGSGARVISPDLPGFGDNPASAQEPSLDLMADDIALLLDHHGCERAVVAGMSMGGYVALSFAERHSNRLAGLALIDSQTAADTEEARTARLGLIGRVTKEGPTAAVKAMLPKLFAPANTDNPDFIEFPTVGAEQAGVAGLTWALKAMAKRPDRTKMLEELSVPLLILHGAEDKIIPADRARQLAHRCKNILYSEVKGAGHCTPIEAPDAVAQALSKLLDKSFPAEAKS